MEKALTVANGFGLSTSVLMRGDGRIELPLNKSKRLFPLHLRCSLADRGEDWEGNVRLSEARQPRPSQGQDSGFDERPLRREEDASRVTGKSRGEAYLEQAMDSKAPKKGSAKSGGAQRTTHGNQVATPLSNLNGKEVDARAPITPSPKPYRVESFRPSARPSSMQKTESSYGKERIPPNSSERDGDGDISLEDEASKVTGKSRGEIFLERAMEARAPVSREVASAAFKARKERAKKREKLSVAVTRRDEPCCYGCGAVLQSSVVEAPGFVPLDTFELKKKHHQLKTVLCGRCVLLSQGEMIPAVSGNGGYGEGKGFVSADELRAQLSHLRYEKALIVKLVDIVDFNGSFLTRVRDLVGSNPIILVATKVDLLPKGTDMAAVGDWLLRATLAKKLNVISIHLTSAKAVTGISGVAAIMQRQRQGRDVYVLGSANVGKSAFISSLLQDMGQRDPIAAAAQRFRPIQSAMPGTTLGPIQIDAFTGGGSLYDTPGVHLHHRMAAVVSPDDLPLLAPRRRLTGRVISAPDPSISLVGQTLFWGGISQIDVLEAPENVSLTFYGPSSIPILGTLTSQSELFYEEEVGARLFPPGGERVKSWPGLVNQQEVTFTLNSQTRPAGDLAISGLGWVTIGTLREDEEDAGRDRRVNNNVRLKVHTPKAVEVFMRPSMPVGGSASEWYEYMEVGDDDVEASRPSLVY